MATQRFKPGDKVKFTQEAKGRFDDDEYWHHANYSSLDLDKVYTIKRYKNNVWPNYSLEEGGTAPHIADYLLEPAETEKKMTKKEYLTKMVEECLDVQVSSYKAGELGTFLNIKQDGCGAFKARIQVDTSRQHNGTVRFELSTPNDSVFVSKDAQKLKDWMTKHGAQVQNTVNSSNRIVFQCEGYPWQCYTEPKVEEQPAAKKIFEPGTKVRFTQEAKERFDDSIYWHYANGPSVRKNLDKTFVVCFYNSIGWPNYSLEDSGNYRFVDYLLEEVSEEKIKPEPKREVAEIIRLREENKELKAKIQELESKLKDQKELKQGKVYINPLLAGTGFTVRFDS